MTQKTDLIGNLLHHVILAFKRISVGLVLQQAVYLLTTHAAL